jgi:hypothetical protein
VALLAGCGNSPSVSGTLQIIKPTGPAYTNTDVLVQAQVAGGASGPVDILLDGALLGTVTDSSGSGVYTYSWATKSVAEGGYQLTARITAGTASLLSTPVTVYIDRTPPTLLSQTPAPAAGNISPSAPAVLQFSEALLPSTVDQAKFQAGIEGYTYTQLIHFTPQLSGDGRTVTLVAPTITVPMPYAVEFQVNPGLTDLAGNPFAATAWIWQVPGWIALSGDLAAGSGPGVAPFAALQMDADGNPVIAFVEQTAQPQALVMRVDGGSWQQLGGAVQPTGFAGPSAMPSLRVDSNGTILVAVRVGSAFPFVLYWDGSAWATLGDVVPGGTGTALGGIGLALGNAQEPVVAFQNESAGRTDVFVSRWDAGTWESLGSVNANGVSDVQIDSLPFSDFPNGVGISTDATDAPLVSFRQSDGVHINGYVFRWNGSAWVQLGQPITAVSGQDVSAGPLLAVGSDGTPFVVFRQSDGTRGNAYVYSWDGSAWMQVGPAISDTSDELTGQPSLALDASNHPLVGAVTSSNAAYVFSLIDNSWSAPNGSLQTTVPFCFPLQAPSLVLDRTGEVVAALPELCSTDVVHVKRLNR